MNSKWMEGRMFIFRSALFVGLGSVVATIIYLTPIPEQFPQSCIRPCHELDWPMICRVKMVVESLPCLGKNCEPGLSTVNRQVPGPAIQVCENDIVVVDVTNKIPGKSFTVHWRGQTLKETPHMDGVSMVTQCPILPYTTFQYKFRASEAGTHFWNFQSDAEGSESLFGPFIVKQADSRDPFRKFYDSDDASHVVTLHTKGSSILINGHNQEHGLPMSFNVTQWRRYRFRVIFGGRPTSCSLRVRVDDTPLILIAIDGHPITPLSASTLELSYGERMDVVLQIESPDNNKHIHIEPDDYCRSLRETSAALIVTEDSNKVSAAVDLEPAVQVRSTVFEDCGNESTVVCLNDLQGRNTLPRALSQNILDHKIFLFFGLRKLDYRSNASIIQPASDGTWEAPHINNRTMLLPSSPIMSQPEDIDPKLFCQDPCENDGSCECTHILHVPLGETVELLLIHKGDSRRRHMFHLHGNSFYVVGATQIRGHPLPEEVMAMEKEGNLLRRNLSLPLLKDTIAIPEKGVAALRFQASNPGYWLLEEQVSPGGMQVLLHVGEPSDLPSTPKNYPRCGSWVGPEFFLT